MVHAGSKLGDMQAVETNSPVKIHWRPRSELLIVQTFQTPLPIA